MKYALHFIYQIEYNYSSKTEVTAGIPITDFTTTLVEEQRENVYWDKVLVLCNRRPENLTEYERLFPATPILLTFTHWKVVDQLLSSVLILGEFLLPEVPSSLTFTVSHHHMIIFKLYKLSYNVDFKQNMFHVYQISRMFDFCTFWGI